MLRGSCYVKSRILQNLQSGTARVRMEIIVEGIHPEKDFAPSSFWVFAGFGRWAISNPALKIGSRELRKLTLRSQVKNAIYENTRQETAADKVEKPGEGRSEPRPLVDPPKKMRMQGT